MFMRMLLSTNTEVLGASVRWSVHLFVVFRISSCLILGAIPNGLTPCVIYGKLNVHTARFSITMWGVRVASRPTGKPEGKREQPDFLSAEQQLTLHHA